MSVVEDLRASVNDILGLRDDIGAGLKPVSIVTRTWSGEEPGDGVPTDLEEPVVPSPYVVEYSDEYRIKEGGAVQQGDIMLRQISKQSYPTREFVDCSVIEKNVEKFYRVGNALYRVIMVKERHLTWNVQLRKVS